jgi:hypothetical protein
MGVRLRRNETPGLIHPIQLPLNALGEIIAWYRSTGERSHELDGEVVIRSDFDEYSEFRILGATCCFTTEECKLDARCRVRVLEHPDIIEIT